MTYDKQDLLLDLRKRRRMGRSGRRANDPGPGHHLTRGSDMAQRTCDVNGCESPAYARGWCSPHYQNWRLHGEPGPVRRPRRPHLPCSVDECTKLSHARGLCVTHYRRLTKYGDLREGDEVRGWGTYRRLNDSGYVQVWCPGHPCAQDFGYVLEHRRVWHDAHGPIPDGFHVHHRNRDRTDNRLENLELLSASEHSRLHHRLRKAQ